MRLKVFNIAVFLCVFVVLQNTKAQKMITDSLFESYKTAVSDSQKLQVLNELTMYLSRSFPDSALNFALEAQMLAEQLNQAKYLAESYRLLGNIYYRKDTFLATQQYWNKALEIYIEKQDSLGIAKIYNNLGALHRTKNNFIEALKQYHKSLEIRIRLNDRKGMGKTFNNIGNVHFSQENYDQALIYYEKSLQIRKEFNDQLGIAGCYGNMGLIYDEKGNHEKAINLYYQAMQIYTDFEDLVGIGESYKKIALSYLDMENIEKTIENAMLSIAIQRKLGNKSSEAFNYIILSEAYNKQQSYSAALAYAKKSLEISESIGIISLKSDTYKQLSIAYEGLYKFKAALKFHKKYLAAKDSLLNLGKMVELENLEAKYQASYKQLQIERLKSDNEVQELRLKRFKNQRILLIIIIIIATSIITVLIITRRRLQRKNKTIFDQNEEITTQKEELEKYRQHLELIVQERTAAFLEAKEKAEESDRLKTAFLANMSHEIRTPLNAIVGFSNLFSFGEVSAENAKEYANLIQSNSFVLINLINDIIDVAKIESGDFRIAKCHTDIYKLSWEVFQSFVQLLKTDTTKNIELLFEPVADKSISIFTDNSRLRQVLNNLINNAIKFTDSGFVKVGYSFIENDLQFYVSDTGSGIAAEDLENIFKRFNKVDKNKNRFYPGTGIGLSISRHIIELLNGKIWVESEPDKGSTFYFRIPVE